jgi:hypothetical protein
LSTVVWIPSAALEPDGDRAEVPVMTCAEAAVSLGEVPTTTTAPGESTTTSTTVPGSSTTIAPTTTAAAVVTTLPPTTVAPTTAPDTQQPTLQVQITSPSAQPGQPPQIFDASWSECPNEAQLVVFANDNRGVVAVTGTYSGLPGSPLNFTFSAGAWRATFGPFSGLSSGFYQDTSITVRARDAAGNLSNPVVVTVEVFGTCVG